MIGQTLGRYRIESKLGEGGMGIVYRAHDEQLEREVAIKVLPASSFSDASARARLLREARTAAALNHPNICTIHEVGESEGHAYIAMELVEGEALSRRLEHGALPAEQALRYGLQMADALAHAHERNVIHRDFKSANVVLSGEGRVKVLDFGLAKRLAGEAAAEGATVSEVSLTQHGAVVGTLAYMAPEQLRGQPADARSDVWALGLVLYEMVAGQRPFQGTTGYELSGTILNQPPPPLPAHVPEGLAAVITRCLEKEPAQRYQRAGEVRAALEAGQSGSLIAPRAARWSRRRWLAASVIAAMVIVAVLVGLRGRLQGTSGAPPITSLAVLPLENLSGDPAQEYFADGMTESLITDLARLSGLKRVIARGSVMRYKGTKKPLSEIARELKVDALITGAVLRSGNRVRLTAQLVNPQTEEQLWTESYERDLNDVLSLQSELTRAIAGEIRLKLSSGERARLGSTRAVNPEAYDAYLKGRFHWQKLSAKELDTAEKYFQLALEKDPNYALAYAGVGTVWALRCNMGIARCTDVIPKWKQAHLKAAELEPNLPQIQAGLAGLKFYADWDWAAAETALRRAIEMDPSAPVTHVWYAEFLIYVANRPEEGIAEMRRALELDPYNSTHQVWVCQALLGTRRYDEAIACLQQVLRTDPNAPMARGNLQSAFEDKQMYGEAMKVWRDSVATQGNREVAEAIERGYAQGGYRGAMRLRAELAVQRSQRQYIAPTALAGYYVRAGEKDLAMDWLEKGYEERDQQMVRLRSPRWDSLRDQPRFQAVLRRMNLPR